MEPLLSVAPLGTACRLDPLPPLLWISLFLRHFKAIKKLPCALWLWVTLALVPGTSPLVPFHKSCKKTSQDSQKAPGLAGPIVPGKPVR